MIELEVMPSYCKALYFMDKTIMIEQFFLFSPYISIFLFFILILLYAIKAKAQTRYYQMDLNYKNEISELKQELEAASKELKLINNNLKLRVSELNKAKEVDVVLKLNNEISTLAIEVEEKNNLLEGVNSLLNISLDKSLDTMLGFFERKFPLDSTIELRNKIKSSQLAQKNIYEVGKDIEIFYGQWDTSKSEYYRCNKPYKDSLKLPIQHNYKILSQLEQWTNAQLLLNAFNVSSAIVYVSVLRVYPNLGFDCKINFCALLYRSFFLPYG